MAVTIGRRAMTNEHQGSIIANVGATLAVLVALSTLYLPLLIR